MCGRYTLAPSDEALIEAFDLPGLPFDLEPRFNIAPGQRVPVVGEDRKGRRIGLLEWGFLPGWKDEPTKPFINARAETVATKASFREAFRRRRCLVPADGFYEWGPGPEGGRKRPHWIHPPAGGVLSFGAIWESWTGSEGSTRHTVAILTTAANADVEGIHERMPLVVAPPDRLGWLDGSTGVGRLEELLAPAPRGTFTARPVSTRLNRTDEDDAGLIEPLA